MFSLIVVIAGVRKEKIWVCVLFFIWSLLEPAYLVYKIVVVWLGYAHIGKPEDPEEYRTRVKSVLTAVGMFARV